MLPNGAMVRFLRQKLNCLEPEVKNTNVVTEYGGFHKSFVDQNVLLMIDCVYRL